MACLLWEDEFYEEGESIATRIKNLIPKVKAEEVSRIAIEAREKSKLRHVPLLIVREMARLDSHRKLVGETLSKVIQRPDELSEFLSIYWKEKKQPLSKQVKLGLAGAFQKFNKYSLAKYNQDGAVKLRDVLFLCHAKPRDAEQEALWKRLIDGKLETPDTWEVSISAVKGNEEEKGAAKKEQWTRLLSDNKLGALALLRNLRNMLSVKVDENLIRIAITKMKTERVLPFRFISAAKHGMHFEPQLEQAMFRCAESFERFEEPTAILIDHSGSMATTVSSKSDITRFEAAAALAMILRETCSNVRVFTFSDYCLEVPPRRGFALRDAIFATVRPQWTLLGKAVDHVYSSFPECQRLIVITDEQSADKPKNPQGKGYVINVASAKNGIGYGAWNHIDGWSEAILDYIRAFEREENAP